MRRERIEKKELSIPLALHCIALHCPHYQHPPPWVAVNSLAPRTRAGGGWRMYWRCWCCWVLISMHEMIAQIESAIRSLNVNIIKRSFFNYFYYLLKVIWCCRPVGYVRLPCPVYERRRLYERTVDTGLCPPLCGLFLPGSSWSIVW